MDDEQVIDGLGATTLGVRAFMNASRELLAHLAREVGVNATDMTALDLLDVHGPMGAAELAAHLGIRSASVTTLVDRLERSGHVARVRHPTDRRRIIVTARPEARAAAVATWLPAVRAIDDVGRALSDDERRVVEDYLARITRAMTDLVGPAAGA